VTCGDLLKQPADTTRLVCGHPIERHGRPRLPAVSGVATQAC